MMGIRLDSWARWISTTSPQRDPHYASLRECKGGGERGIGLHTLQLGKENVRYVLSASTSNGIKERRPTPAGASSPTNQVPNILPQIR